MIIPKTRIAPNVVLQVISTPSRRPYSGKTVAAVERQNFHWPHCISHGIHSSCRETDISSVGRFAAIATLSMQGWGKLSGVLFAL